MAIINVDSKWFNNVVAQLGHFAAGGWCVANSQLHWGHAWIGIVIIASVAAVKEYVIDYFIEGQGFWNNTLDFSMYMAGALTQTYLFK